VEEEGEVKKGNGGWAGDEEGIKGQRSTVQFPSPKNNNLISRDKNIVRHWNRNFGRR